MCVCFFLYQQTPDKLSDILGHVRGLGATGGQLYQRHQEVLAFLHVLQGLLREERVRKVRVW